MRHIQSLTRNRMVVPQKADTTYNILEIQNVIHIITVVFGFIGQAVKAFDQSGA